MTKNSNTKIEKKLAIAAAAAELFGAYGIDKITIEQVAVKAGIGKGTVYEYFKSKDELVHGSFEALMMHMEEEITKGAPENIPPLEALKELSFMIIESIDHAKSMYGFMFEYILFVTRRGVESKPLKNMLTGFRQIVSGYLQKAQKAGDIKQDIDCDLAAATYIAWFDGAPLHGMILKKPDILKMAENYIGWFIDSISSNRENVEKGMKK